MLFLIRETLLINWGKGNNKISVFKKDEVKNELKTCRDFIDCEYCKAENKRIKAEWDWDKTFYMNFRVFHNVMDS